MIKPWPCAFALVALAALLAISTESSSEPPPNPDLDPPPAAAAPPELRGGSEQPADQGLLGVWTGHIIGLFNQQSHVTEGLTIAFDGEKMHTLFEGHHESIMCSIDTQNKVLNLRNVQARYWLKEDNLTLFMKQGDDNSSTGTEEMIYSLTRQPSFAEILEIPESRPVGVGRPAASEEKTRDVQGKSP